MPKKKRKKAHLFEQILNDVDTETRTLVVDEILRGLPKNWTQPYTDRKNPEALQEEERNFETIMSHAFQIGQVVVSHFERQDSASPMAALFGKTERAKAISCKLILAHMKERPLGGVPHDKTQEICVDNLYGAELPDDIHKWLMDLLDRYILGETICIPRAGEGARMASITLRARLYVAGLMAIDVSYFLALKLIARKMNGETGPQGPAQAKEVSEVTPKNVEGWIFRPA